MKQASVLASASAIALTVALGSTPALAQQTGASTAQLEEIIVTAQRREENIQKASVSIEALSTQALVERGVSNAQALNDVVPGLKLAYTGAQVQVFVRGVGDASANSYTQASVSLNMDGVYVARSQAFGAVFFDTARVEVLRGPQGTLYGRNSSGGAINIISNKPEMGQFGGNASVELGNYNLVRAQGVANIPLSDTFAIRAAAQSVRRDGYLSDNSNNENSEALRVHGLWKPSDTLSLLMSAEHAQAGGAAGRVYRPALFGDPWTSSQDDRVTYAAFSNIPLRFKNTHSMKYTGVSAELNWDVGPGTLTVLPAYRHLKDNSFAAGDFLFAENVDSKQSSLEVRYGGDIGAFRWVLGAYGFNEDLSTFVRSDQRTGPSNSGRLQIQDYPTFDTDAWAVFGETTFSVTEQLRLIAGLRYTSEDRTRAGTVRDTNFVAGVASPTTSLSVPGSITNEATTWKAGAEYDLAEENMLYATVSRGFKSGGFDAAGPDPYKPEFVTAYTVGSKNRFFGNTLQLNLEGFYWKYEDQQTAFLGQDSRGLISFITRNAGQATIKGVDMDMIWKPTANDTIDAGLEYLKTNYDSFVYNTAGVNAAGVLLADGCVSRGPAPAAGQFIEDCSGKPLPRTPEWSGNVRYSHRFDLSSGANITVAGTAKFQGDHVLQVNYRSPNFTQEAYELYDADITYNAPNGQWMVQAYVRNIGVGGGLPDRLQRQHRAGDGPGPNLGERHRAAAHLRRPHPGELLTGGGVRIIGPGAARFRPAGRRAQSPSARAIDPLAYPPGSGFRSGT